MQQRLSPRQLRGAERIIETNSALRGVTAPRLPNCNH
jgi:hypothetical protein